MIADALRLDPLPGLPIVGPGDDLPHIIAAAAERAGMTFGSEDVVCVASKMVSRAEDRFVDLSTIEPSPEATDIASTTGHDPRLVTVILKDTAAVSRAHPGVLVVRHRLGHVSANAGVDSSNARPPGRTGDGPWILTLPIDPDASARRLRAALGVAAVIVTDSIGRPFRIGSVGIAIGVAGMPAVLDHRGRPDLDGRQLQHTTTALADQIATAADLVAGQSDEGRGVIRVRGLRFESDETTRAAHLHRPVDKDLYA